MGGREDTARQEIEAKESPLPFRILEWLPIVSATPIDPEYVPEEILGIAEKHGLEVVIISVDKEQVGVALCNSMDETPPES